MALERSNSVRFRPKQTTRISSFRDDTSLIGLRYEQTKQAEPPIRILATNPTPAPPPRNPLRSFRSASVISRGYPVQVILPPQALAPPQEQHPLFRLQGRPLSSTDEWKRDSGAPTTSSGTLQGDTEEEFDYQRFVEKHIAPSFISKDEDVFNVAPLRTRPPALAQLPSSPSPSPRRAKPVAFTLDTTTFVSDNAAATGSATGSEPSTSMFRTNSRETRSSLPVKKLQKRTLSDAQLVSPTKSAFNPSKWGSLRSSNSPKSHVLSPTTAGAGEPSPQSALSVLGSSSRVSISSRVPADIDFMPITTDIPTDSLLADEDLFEQLEFSKRGSIMFGAKRSTAPSSSSHPAKPSGRDASQSHLSKDRDNHGASSSKDARVVSRDTPSTTTVPNIRVLSADIERESQKVRSLYDSTESVNWRDGGRASTIVGRTAAAVDAPSNAEEKAPHPSPSGSPFPSTGKGPRTSPGLTTGTPPLDSLSPQRGRSARKEYELAGGLEDWEDVDSADVDRFGFINERKTHDPRPGSIDTASDDFHLSPPSRRRNMLLGLRPNSSYNTSPSGRSPTRKWSARSLNTQNTDLSQVSRRFAARAIVRQASNRLPHNRNRRWMDEAGDMLNLAPGLAAIDEEVLSDKAAAALKKKEAERTEKWRKMAKTVKKGRDGEGMEFEFDTKNQKLIDRTWKGIPEHWRATAWFSFLATSARNMGSQETVDRLQAEYFRLQDVASPDDYQIDLDVPRTVNGHVMFRKRYRGGQRLLFRVLHAMSIYFSDVGYVQGMASLAATLLCYFEEERCFVMMVRMWRYRGLERLYQPGFAGLIATLDDFKSSWLARKEVAKKLNEFEIDPTAYGTRWYLTLFNLSIPFPAQLRVWDVFMLLGECTPEQSAPGLSGPLLGKNGPFRGLDILHATSAALIDALNEVLLEADFENAMKALASWIPVKDDDMLMKVIRAEWKSHQRR